tara:strand:- start:14826 stop:15131 length:306 start_codon:yes stop_codon:yes gene_type:complete
MKKYNWDNYSLDWGHDTKNDNNNWGTYFTKEYGNERITLPTILKGLDQINEDNEVFLPSELVEIERLVNLAISRKKRGIIGEANITQEEREKTINKITKDY